MDVTPLIARDSQVIQSYANGVFKVSGQAYESPIIVHAESTSPWNVTDFESLIAQDFEGLSGFDVVLLGTGRIMQIIPPLLRAELKQAGLSVDSMDTGAACRTYNVLMAEGRRVVAALLPYI